jgi:hypothetical protein
MNYTTTYRAWVSSIGAAKGVGRTKYVTIHLHTYIPGETSIELTGEPLDHPNGERCSEVVLERSVASGLAVGDLVDVEVSLTLARLTTDDAIRGLRKAGLGLIYPVERMPANMGTELPPCLREEQPA